MQSDAWDMVPQSVIKNCWNKIDIFLTLIEEIKCEGDLNDDASDTNGTFKIDFYFVI